MADLALEEIIAVEKEIQERLKLEQRKIEAWLAEERERLDRESETRLSAARRKCQEEIEEADTETRGEVSRLVANAESYRQHLTSLPDEKLEEVLERHLNRILPEETS